MKYWNSGRWKTKTALFLFKICFCHLRCPRSGAYERTKRHLAQWFPFSFSFPRPPNWATQHHKFRNFSVGLGKSGHVSMRKAGRLPKYCQRHIFPLLLQLGESVSKKRTGVLPVPKIKENKKKKNREDESVSAFLGFDFGPAFGKARSPSSRGHLSHQHGHQKYKGRKKQARGSPRLNFRISSQVKAIQLAIWREPSCFAHAQMSWFTENSEIQDSWAYAKQGGTQLFSLCYYSWGMRSTLSLGAMKQPSDLPGRPPKFINRPPRKHQNKGKPIPGKNRRGVLPARKRKEKRRTEVVLVGLNALCVFEWRQMRQVEGFTGTTLFDYKVKPGPLPTSPQLLLFSLVKLISLLFGHFLNFTF